MAPLQSTLANSSETKTVNLFSHLRIQEQAQQQRIQSSSSALQNQQTFLITELDIQRFPMSYISKTILQESDYSQAVLQTMSILSQVRQTSTWALTQ